MPDIHKPCSDNDNWACMTCILLYEAVDSDGVCKDTKHTPNYMCRVEASGSTIQISRKESEDNIKHWKIVPGHAIRGTEDVAAATAGAYDQLWRDGWQAVKTKSLPFNHTVTPDVNVNEMGFVINSAWTRTAHQMHIHIAKVDSKFYTDFPKIKSPGTFDSTWHDIGNGHHDGKMMCPGSSTSLHPFTAMHNAISGSHWKGTNLTHHTTIAVISPSFCKDTSSTCAWCQLLLYNVGDHDILHY